MRPQVQDMPNPEYYVSQFRRADGNWQTSRYQDELEEQVPYGSETKIAERKPLLVVPVPGESPWVQRLHAAEAAASLPATPAPAPGGGTKRGRPDAPTKAGDDDVMSMSFLVSEATGQTDATDDMDSAASRARTEAGSATGCTAAAPFPAADIPAGACVVFVYDEVDVKLNDVIEVVGILSRVPELAAAHLTANNENADGNTAHPTPMTMLEEEALETQLPTSKAPRLHALLVAKETAAYPAACKNAAAATPAVLAEGRARALGFLSMVLGGDDLAAEFLLLQLVSRVHLRSTDAGALGTLPVNLTSCPSAMTSAPSSSPAPTANLKEGLSPLGAAIAAALEALAPRCQALALSVDRLNSGPWWPRRPAEEGCRLSTGPLQLAPCTQVLLDETAMQAGTLSEVGMHNLAALQDLMRSQKVGYDFEFFALEQPADAPVTILSTARTLLKGTGEVEVRLQPAAPPASGAAAVEAAAAAADLGPARTYLAAARALEFSIPEEVGCQVERELAQAKHIDSKNVTQETFHRWLNVSLGVWVWVRIGGLGMKYAVLTRGSCCGAGWRKGRNKLCMGEVGWLSVAAALAVVGCFQHIWPK